MFELFVAKLLQTSKLAFAKFRALGARAAQILASGVPASWKVILIDRNS
jgi:hypothetical protein